jgi:hypothetical protein
MSLADDLMLEIHEASSPARLNRQLAYDKTRELWRYARSLEDQLAEAAAPKPVSALERVALDDDFGT